MRVKKIESFFGCAYSLCSWFPSDNIWIRGVDDLSTADFFSSMIIKDLEDDVEILVMSVVVPEIRDSVRQIRTN
jgi:hypothetical protein